MSNNIYTNFDIEKIKSKIDISRLKRDYSKEPLKTTKNGIGSEFLTKEELEYLYIELNLHQEEIAIFCGTKINKIQRMTTKLNIIKPIELINKQQEETNIKKYGTKTPFQNKEIINKIDNTFLKRYGCRRFTQTKEYIEVFHSTCQKKYGVNNHTQLDSVKEKSKQTKLARYGNENYVNVEKAKQTKLERYGNENYNNIEKMQSTCKERYGTTSFTQTEEYINKTKNTYLEKYGIEWFTKTEEYNQKVKNTCQEKYGVSHYSQTEESKQKHRNTFQNKYGVPYYSQTKECQQKVFNTKKKNKALNSSKIEDRIYKILLTKFPKTIHHPDPSELYPFQCDFYVPELNLYIEYQGYASHGKEVFKPSNNNHLNLIKDYKKKAEEINYKGEKKVQYLRYIYTWTFRDPLKRQTAWLNRLNWKEFFTFKEFMEWFNSH